MGFNSGFKGLTGHVLLFSNVHGKTPFRIFFLELHKIKGSKFFRKFTNLQQITSSHHSMQQFL